MAVMKWEDSVLWNKLHFIIFLFTTSTKHCSTMFIWQIWFYQLLAFLIYGQPTRESYMSTAPWHCDWPQSRYKHFIMSTYIYIYLGLQCSGILTLHCWRVLTLCIRKCAANYINVVIKTSLYCHTAFTQPQ